MQRFYQLMYHCIFKVFNIQQSAAASREECFLTGILVVLILIQKLLHFSQYSQISPAQAIVRSFNTQALGQIHKLK